MTTVNNNESSQDDKVLAQLYKEGAKEGPPEKLNQDIIKYAANASKPDVTKHKVGSHFGGGWKVPLSMAACLVVVFALLIQLEQSPQSLELPPIPEITSSTNSKDELFKSKTSPSESNAEEGIAEVMADEAPTIQQEAGKLGGATSDMINLKEKQTSTITPNTQKAKSNSDRQLSQEPLHKPSRERLIPEDRLENANRADKLHTDTMEQITPTPHKPITTESKSSKPHVAKKQMQLSNDDALTNQSETSSSETFSDGIQSRSIATDSSEQEADVAGTKPEPKSGIDSEKGQEFAPIPVEDWLLMIEQLVARKDYAEAARQLEKFKYKHPKVNVDDLDTKIP